jgi:two-component system response regulator HydG
MHTPRLRTDDDDLQFDASTDALAPLRIPGATTGQLERHAMLTTLEAVHGSTAKAAEVLDLSVRTIPYRLSEYGAAASETPRRGMTN